jgi:hypothetical protein
MEELHNEGFQNLSSSPNILGYQINEDKIAGHVARVGKKRNAQEVLVGRPKRRKSLERPKTRHVK